MGIPFRENCGCDFLATKRINKTAAKLDIRFKKSTTIQVWSIYKFLAIICVTMLMPIMPSILPSLIFAEAAPTTTTMSVSTTSGSTISAEFLLKASETLPKLRVRKHSHHNTVDWENPCNGEYKRNNNIHLSREMILRDLRRTLRQQRSFIINKNMNAINVTGIQEWFSHNATYRFLARVKPQVHINLTRWHRNMQIYVASMSYFKRKQRVISQRKSTKFNFDISRELEELYHSTRGTLCLIEAAINKTNQNDKIHTIPREQMKKRLKFRTKNNYPPNHDYEIEELDFIDLQFIKVRYFEIMLGMNKSLTRYLRESKCNKTNLNSSLSSEYSGSLIGSNSLYNSRSLSGSTESNEKISNMCKRIRQRRKFEHRNRSKRIRNSRQHNSSASY